MTSWITDALVPAAMFVLMLAMGFTLSAADFRRVARYPVPTLVGTALQLLAMPLAAIALARAFDLPPLLAVGLAIVGACPGGTVSNLLAHLGRADTALSITLTATATLATLFTLPLWVRFALAGGAESAVAIEMPVLDTAARLAVFTVVPVALGMLARRARPEVVRFERALSLASAFVIIAGLTVESATRDELPVAELAQSLAPALWLCGAGFAMGWLVPLATGASAGEAATIAIELCVKNTVLGLVLATGAFHALEPAVPIVAYMTFQLAFAGASIALLLVGRRFGVCAASGAQT